MVLKTRIACIYLFSACISATRDSGVFVGDNNRKEITRGVRLLIVMTLGQGRSRLIL